MRSNVIVTVRNAVELYSAVANPAVGVIYLLKGLRYNLMRGELHVTRNVTLQGIDPGQGAANNAYAVLDANANTSALRRVLHVACGAEVKLYDLELTGALMLRIYNA